MPVEQASASAGGSDTCTLPGDIPGLLRRGSPVVPRGAGGRPHRGTVCAVVPGSVPGYVVAWSWDNHPGVDSIATWGGGDVLLDLTDATGRAHAAWWLRSQDYPTRILPALRALSYSNADRHTADSACCFGYASGADAEALRRVCLCVAGRA